MATILVRTILIYVLLLFTMRLMGKRQLGELEISELVSTLLLSDIASLPIGNQDIPLTYALIPIITITTFEVASSFLLTKCPGLKNLLESSPSVLICRGKINKGELAKNRISVEELLGELRQKAITDPRDVEYAILEKNGKLTVIPTAESSQPTCRQLAITTERRGLSHVLIADGKINPWGLHCIGQNEEWLYGELQKQELAQKDIFLLTMDDAGGVDLIKQEDVIQ